MSEADLQQIKSIENEFSMGQQICLSACKLMNFNVEDIMALP